MTEIKHDYKTIIMESCEPIWEGLIDDDILKRFKDSFVMWGDIINAQLIKTNKELLRGRKWEYMDIWNSTDKEKALVGLEGWECFSVCEEESNIIHSFKRPIQDD